MRAVLLFLLLILIIPLHAQEKPLTEINGRITDDESGEPVPFVHIYNERTGAGTVSSERGTFRIFMAEDDTLTFSAIGFEPYYFRLTGTSGAARLDVSIVMNTSTLELKPVRVFAYKDEESLKKAILEMDVTETEEKRGIELPGFYYGPRRPYKPSAFGSPISFIASKFSKEVKEQKLLEKAEREADYRRMIRAKYNEEIVMELTGLSEAEVGDFMEFCKIEEAFISRSGAYEIALAVSQCYTRYREEK